MRLDGRVAVVTGAASGIGRSIVRAFRSEGARVLALDVDEAGLDKVAGSTGAEPVVCDVSDADALCAVLDRERIDILCNNAGVLDALTPLHDVDDALWRRVQKVNVDGPFFASRAVIPGMVERGGGVIVNTCSAASLSGGRAGFAYTASKHALLGMTRSIAWYYGEQGIRCNAVAPGAIQTKMHMRQPPHGDGMGRYARYFETMPPHGRAADVAAAVLFLASDEAAYVNGQCLGVDGGWGAF